MSDELEKKLMDLEMRLSFQEETIDQLNDAIVHQSKTIEVLTKSFKILTQRLASLDAEPSDVTDQRPPHY